MSNVVEPGVVLDVVAGCCPIDVIATAESYRVPLYGASVNIGVIAGEQVVRLSTSPTTPQTIHHMSVFPQHVLVHCHVQGSKPDLHNAHMRLRNIRARGSVTTTTLNAIQPQQPQQSLLETRVLDMPEPAMAASVEVKSCRTKGWGLNTSWLVGWLPRPWAGCRGSGKDDKLSQTPKHGYTICADYIFKRKLYSRERK